MPFELIPEKLIYGGDALGHYQGRTILVPRALPGERLEVEPLRTVKGVVHARPVRVLESAPDRAVPPCPYFGQCGGCQYQHLLAPHQALWKREILRETLRRIGKIIWKHEIRVHTGYPWHYRNQAHLKVARRADGQVELGFFAAQSHRLVPVEACTILSPRLNTILSKLREPEWSSRLASVREIDLLADDQDQHVMTTLRGVVGVHQEELLADSMLARLSGVTTVAVEKNHAFRIFGSPALSYNVGEFRYQISPGSFFQSSRFLLAKLVARVTADESVASDPVENSGMSTEIPAPISASNSSIATRETQPKAEAHEGLALDLFAGVGLFTLPLARRFEEVIAVESHAQAATDLATNARAHALSNVRCVRANASDFLRRFARLEPGLVVLDPPRAGVGPAGLMLLIRCLPKRVHYVSCSPSTLARDLGYLIRQGYQLNDIELFDFFPQTYHLECLAKLTPAKIEPT